MKTFAITLVFLLSSLCFAEPDSIERIEIRDSKANFFQLANPAQESLSDKQIKDRSLFHGEELWSQFANLSTASGSNRTRYFKIRGIGERSEYDTMPSNSVGVFYDHIDLGGLSGVLALYDVGQVEVLKGPQTFLYGDSSIGGNVLFTSLPVTETHTSVWTDWGSQNHRMFGTRSGVVISDNFSMKFGFQKNNSDGYFYNPHWQDHTSKRDESFGNIGWQWNVGSSLITGSHIYGENKNGNDLWNTDNSFNVFSDRKGHDDQLTHGHSLEWTGPLSQRTQYLMIASYSHSDQLVSYDEDWNNNDFWNLIPGWNKNYDYFKAYNRRKANLHLKSIMQHQWKHWDFSYGLHYYQKVEKTDVNSYRNAILRNNLIADFQSDKVALLKNVNYRFSPRANITLSSRIEQQEIRYQDSQGFESLKKSTPFAFNLRYQYASGQHTWQALVARGFKGAGFNPEINLTRDQQEYDPEYAMNYEVRWRHENRRYQNSISLFYMDRRHHQITTSSQDDPTDPSKFTLFVDNAAQSEHYGLEWQGQWQASPRFSFFSSVGFLDAQFVDYQLRNRSYDGRELAHSPTYTFALTSVVRLTSSLQLTLNTTGRDGFLYSNSHDEVAQDNILLNSSLNWTPTNKLTLSLWGKNIFNSRYSQRGFYFGNEPPSFQARLYEQNAAPLEWGLRANYNF